MDITHTVKRVALASVALCCMGAEVQSNELNDLKNEIANLQNRIDVLEQSPARPAASTDTNTYGMITFRRGSEATSDWVVNRVGDGMPSDRGMTIAITPSADLPAPVHEVTISGYVKGDFIYDFGQDLGDYFAYSQIVDNNGRKHARLHARQSRFRILSKSDTSIGQIRTMVEGDFYSGGPVGSTDFRLRHAWGEWDMTPNWTFGAGQTNRNFMSLITGITTVDFNGPAGLIGTSRIGQMRLTYRDGPHTLAFSIEDPTGEDEWTTRLSGFNDDMPDLVGRWQYDAPGGHQFLASAAGRHFTTKKKLGAARSDDTFGWVVQGGANINLADVATLTAGVIYGQGAGNYIIANAPAYWVDPATGSIETITSMGVFAGISVPITDTTTANFGWGMTKPDGKQVKKLVDSGVATGTMTRQTMSVHGNIIWRPVNELQLGWEVIYGQRTYNNMSNQGNHHTGDNIRAQFGAWFFF